MSVRHTAALAGSLLLVPALSGRRCRPPPAAAAGIQWTVPPRWTAGAGSAMRVATYAVPAAKGAEAGECAVFFFGTGQGGGVDDNVARWAKQFEGAPAPKTTTATVGGMRVTRAEVAGAYLAPGGPMMQSTGKKAGLPPPRRDRRGARGERLLQADGPGRHGRRRAGRVRRARRLRPEEVAVALRAAVFDFDGVLVDSEPLHFRSLRDALRPEGIGITEEEYPEAPRLRRPGGHPARARAPGEGADPARRAADRGPQGRTCSPA